MLNSKLELGSTNNRGASKTWPKNAVLAACLGAVLSISAIAIAQSTTAAHSEHLTDMQKVGVARIPVVQLPPWMFTDNQGVPQGYLSDVTREVMTALGVPKLDGSPATYDAMIPALLARQFDFVPSGLNITTERCRVVLFSHPLVVHQDALAVALGNPKGIEGYDSVAKDPALTLAALAGSTQEKYALSRGVKRSQIQTVPDTQTGRDAVTGGRVDAFAIGRFELADAKRQGGKFDYVVDPVAPMLASAVAFRKDDAALRDAFDEVLAKLRESGKLSQLYEKHGFDNSDALVRARRGEFAEGCQ